MLLGCKWTGDAGQCCERDATGAGGFCRAHSVSDRLLASFERAWLSGSWRAAAWRTGNVIVAVWIAIGMQALVLEFRSGRHVYIELETNPAHFLLCVGLLLLVAARLMLMMKRWLLDSYIVAWLVTAGVLVLLDILGVGTFAKAAPGGVLAAATAIGSRLDGKRGTVVPCVALIGLVLMGLSALTGFANAIIGSGQGSAAVGRSSARSLVTGNIFILAVVIDIWWMLWSQRQIVSISRLRKTRWLHRPACLLSLLGQTRLCLSFFGPVLGTTAILAIQVLVWRHGKLAHRCLPLEADTPVKDPRELGPSART